MRHTRAIARGAERWVRGDSLVSRAVWLTIVVCIGMRCGWAGGGGVTRFAYGNPRRGSGLSVEIDNRWIAGDGYRPVRVLVRPIGKARFTRDRQVTIVLHRGTVIRNFPVELTTQVIDLPEGAAEVTQWVYVQQNRVQTKMGVEFWEGRRELRNVYSSPLVERSGNANWSDAAPCMLILDFDMPLRNVPPSPTAGTSPDVSDEKPDDAIGRNLPGLGAITGIRPLWVPQSGSSKGLTWARVESDVPTFQYLSPYDLPSVWIGLTAVDIGIVDVDDLDRLRSELPDRWRVIVAWLRNGGMLWVTGVGQGFERLAEVNAALEIERVALIAGAESPEQGASEDATDDMRKSLVDRPSATEQGTGGWQLVRRGKSKSGLKIFQPQEGDQWINGLYTQVQLDEDNIKFPEDISADSVMFATRNVQFGQVVSWASADPLAREGRAYWEVVFKRLGVDRWMWSNRQGFSLVRENLSFWNFLIPGVGLAPVNLFRVVITLFVLFIGPINYSILKRWKRLNWILITVPLSAILVTFALTNYALFTDGISVKARVRSVTSLDQRSGHAVTWSRQTYYAGIAPSEGLVFPANVAVYPVDYDPIARFDGRGQVRNVVWDEQQRLSTGFLPSRTTAQVMVQRSGPSSIRIDFHEGREGLQGFTNHLGGDIEQLLVVDAAGNYFVADRVAEASEGKLRQVSRADGQAWLTEHCGTSDLSVPPGVDPQAAISRSIGDRWRYSSANGQLVDTADSTSRMEQILQQRSTRGCPARSYVAILRGGTEVPLGVSSARLKDSRYFVVGNF